MNLLVLLALLGSPSFQVRDKATKALGKLTDYRHPVLLAGMTSGDPEVAERCRGINGRHLSRLVARIKGAEEWPSLFMWGWDGESMLAWYADGSRGCGVDWIDKLAARSDNSRRATGYYVRYMLDYGVPPPMVRASLWYMRRRQAEYASRYGEYIDGYCED